MAQFDVYKNLNKNTQKAFPYMVDIQNSIVSDISTRIVIPLGKASHFKNQQMEGLTLEIGHDEENLVLITPQLASVPATILKEPIGSLEHMRDDIVAALDFLITEV